MVSNEIILFIVCSYLTGSFPSAVFVGRTFFNLDVREFGSGNAGAANTFRVLGFKAGFTVFVLDVLKGFMAVNYVTFLSNSSTLLALNPEGYFEASLVFGIAAVLGHLFPIYTGFRGGKGISTMLGLLLGVHFIASIYSLISFIIILLITRYVSVASILSSFVFMIIILFFFEVSSSLSLFSLFVPVLSLITHQKNIERLIRGEETKVIFGKK